MDEIVVKAMAKWPNVPHCFGWLALDPRGNWRMRDDYAQAKNLHGERITHTALLSFITRNYGCDEYGRWFFQNGPQRVFVNLEATPFIAHSDPAQGFVLHTGEPLPWVDSAWLTDTGNLILEGVGKIAQLDDRDLVDILPLLRQREQTVSEEGLLDWMNEQSNDRLILELPSRHVPVRHLKQNAVEHQFGFVSKPQALPGDTA